MTAITSLSIGVFITYAMVADVSAVLPDVRAVDSDDAESPFAFEDIDGDYRSRASRPSQDEGWMDDDHYMCGGPRRSQAAH